MKKLGIVLVFLVFVTSASVFAQSGLVEFLESKDGIVVEETNFPEEFAGGYFLDVTQPLDHKHPEKGSFTQRVFVLDRAADKPTVFITEGYAANYAASGRAVYELSKVLDANQVCVEHRYFGESVPENDSIYTYLTTYQAASDHHAIVDLLKEYYTGKWINSGISKGGQTVMYHNYYYPEDVDVSVPYVAPLNFAKEDPRVYTWLDNVGTKKCRKKILRLQKHLLKNKDIFLPMFEEGAKEAKATFAFGDEVGFEYCVLEYPFAFWQWGTYSCDQLPRKKDGNDEIYDHFITVSGYGYLSDQGVKDLEPFFYQALTEIGYYGYETDDFKGLLSQNAYTYDFTVSDYIDVEFNPDVMEKVHYYIQNEAENMLFIYGKNDTWSSTGVVMETEKPTMVVKVLEGGAHGTRIRNFPFEERKEIYSTLADWLDISIPEERYK